MTLAQKTNQLPCFQTLKLLLIRSILRNYLKWIYQIIPSPYFWNISKIPVMIIWKQKSRFWPSLPGMNWERLPSCTFSDFSYLRFLMYLFNKISQMHQQIIGQSFTTFNSTKYSERGTFVRRPKCAPCGGNWIKIWQKTCRICFNLAKNKRNFFFNSWMMQWCAATLCPSLLLEKSQWTSNLPLSWQI